MTQTCGLFVEQVVFLTVYHRGPLPLREIHSTDETISMERPWGILGLFTTCFQTRVNSPCQRLWHRHDCDVFAELAVFLTVNHRGPLPLRELHSTGDTISMERP